MKFSPRKLTGTESQTITLRIHDSFFVGVQFSSSTQTNTEKTVKLIQIPGLKVLKIFRNPSLLQKAVQMACYPSRLFYECESDVHNTNPWHTPVFFSKRGKKFRVLSNYKESPEINLF